VIKITGLVEHDEVFLSCHDLREHPRQLQTTSFPGMLHISHLMRATIKATWL